MIEFEYANTKAVLITSDDLFAHDHRYQAQVGAHFWETWVSELRKKGIRWVFVVTSMSRPALPKPLREICRETKNCFVGDIYDK